MPSVGAPGTGYSFGDTRAAEQRLDLVAAVFDRPSRAFLSRAVSRAPRLAFDLGCGPGNTTRMIRSVTGARRVIGLDASAAFVRAATERAADGIEFRVWDARTSLPPGEAPDLVYARLLLAHLPDAARLAVSWAGQLGPDGQLLLDEVERIDTDGDVLREYLDVVVTRVRDSGSEMYAGPVLAGIAPGGSIEIASDEVVPHPVPAADAARMFRLNLSVWGGDPWVTEHVGEDVVARLDRDLSLIAAGQARCEITWWLRQMVIRRSRITGEPGR